MGRVMDAVLAMSTLAMALTVAWADWVISCCKVSSEAMSSMVRSAKWGGYKNVYYLGTVGLIELKLGQKVPKGGALPICVIVGGATMLASVLWHH